MADEAPDAMVEKKRKLEDSSSVPGEISELKRAKVAVLQDPVALSNAALLSSLQNQLPVPSLFTNQETVPTTTSAASLAKIVENVTSTSTTQLSTKKATETPKELEPNKALERDLDDEEEYDEADDSDSESTGTVKDEPPLKASAPQILMSLSTTRSSNQTVPPKEPSPGHHRKSSSRENSPTTTWPSTQDSAVDNIEVQSSASESSASSLPSSKVIRKGKRGRKPKVQDSNGERGTPESTYSRGITPELINKFSFETGPDGKKRTSTGVLDSTKLFDWLRKNHSSLLTPSQYRTSIRLILERNSNGVIDPQVRELLCTKIRHYGKKSWGFQTELKGTKSESESSDESSERSVSGSVSTNGKKRSRKPLSKDQRQQEPPKHEHVQPQQSPQVVVQHPFIQFPGGIPPQFGNLAAISPSTAKLVKPEQAALPSSQPTPGSIATKPVKKPKTPASDNNKSSKSNKTVETKRTHTSKKTILNKNVTNASLNNGQAGSQTLMLLQQSINRPQDSGQQQQQINSMRSLSQQSLANLATGSTNGVSSALQYGSSSSSSLNLNNHPSSVIPSTYPQLQLQQPQSQPQPQQLQPGYHQVFNGGQMITSDQLQMMLQQQQQMQQPMQQVYQGSLAQPSAGNNNSNSNQFQFASNGMFDGQHASQNPSVPSSLMPSNAPHHQFSMMMNNNDNNSQPFAQQHHLQQQQQQSPQQAQFLAQFYDGQNSMDQFKLAQQYQLQQSQQPHHSQQHYQLMHDAQHHQQQQPSFDMQQQGVQYVQVPPGYTVQLLPDGTAVLKQIGMDQTQQQLPLDQQLLQQQQQAMMMQLQFQGDHPQGQPQQAMYGGMGGSVYLPAQMTQYPQQQPQQPYYISHG